jgi:hypothetical protein
MNNKQGELSRISGINNKEKMLYYRNLGGCQMQEINLLLKMMSSSGLSSAMFNENTDPDFESKIKSLSSDP